MKNLVAVSKLCNYQQVGYGESGEICLDYFLMDSVYVLVYASIFIQ